MKEVSQAMANPIPSPLDAPARDIAPPAPPAPPGDPARSVVDRAARRIAQVYELPLVRYRCLELSVVEDDG